MEEKSQSLISIYKNWNGKLPVTKKDYLFHFLLILDCILILLKDSYEGLLTSYYFSLGIFLFDLFVVTAWGLSFIRRLRLQDNKIDYIINRWYNLLGIMPFNIFRLFLLLATFKHLILLIKYLQRGVDDRRYFSDQEFSFTFWSMFIDSISDAIYLNSLERVEEVVHRLEFDKITKDILTKHEPDLRKMVENTIKNKSIIGKLESIPLMKGISNQMTDDITSIVKETLESETTANITRELNLIVLKEMEKNVKSLGLDRISEPKENK